MNESSLNLQASRLRNRTKRLIEDNINSHRDSLDLKRDVNRYGAYQVRSFQGSQTSVYATMGQFSGGTTVSK